MIRRTVPAALLPVLVTVSTLAGAAWNRSGGRGPTMLTHRELPMRFASDENSGQSLAIRHGDAGLMRAWLTREKLASLGFDTAVDAASPDADAHYARALPRTAYLVLEFDGPAWQSWAREYAANTRRWNPDADTARILDESSRLVAVDAGLDAATLEARYPNPQTHLITRGVIDVFVDHIGGRPHLAGVLQAIAPRTLYVPREFAARLTAKPYTVSVRYGRRYEPWIVGVEP